MSDQLHSGDGKEILCCCSSVCTRVVVVQHESTMTSFLAALTSGLQTFRQSHVLASNDCTSVQKGYSGK